MEVAVAHPPGTSIIARMASRFGVEPNKMLGTLKATAFRGEVSNEQMMALLIVAEQYKLNPWVKEIYAFPDKNNGIVPVVGVDGWLRILNADPNFNGVEFKDGPIGKDNLPEWIECTIHRKDREHPTVTREYMAECKRGTGPWSSHPRRMLRHKALIQCSRIAMSFGGIYDEDEAQRIIEGEGSRVPDAAPAIASLNEQISGKAKPATIEHDAEPAAPTYADVAALLNLAEGEKSAELLAQARDLARSVESEQHRAELDVEAKRVAKVIEG